MVEGEGLEVEGAQERCGNKDTERGSVAHIRMRGKEWREIILENRIL